MTEEEKQRIKSNVEKSHYASAKSRFQQSGVSREPSKINSKNFNRILEQRGLSKEGRQQMLDSVDRSEEMTTRHAKAGEKFVITHGDGVVDKISGVYVAKESQGNTPEERIDKLSLPPGNTAEYETIVELTRDQNLIETKVRKQEHFQKMDPKHLPRNGGGHQVITDGGYRTADNKEAIRNRDPKYPVPVNSNSSKSSMLQKGQSM